MIFGQLIILATRNAEDRGTNSDPIGRFPGTAATSYAYVGTRTADSLGIDRRKIDRGVLLHGFDKQSEIDVPMDKIDVLFDSDSPIKWDRIVQNGGRESSEQGGKLW